jgi:hypothetical protein
MTRKDFIIVARILKELPAGDVKNLTVARAIVELRATNPNFNAERFRRACYE